eukprot:CAMPEP_0119557146 /NCGR_PEP_ID=MMETSP1352-20130426/8903_1 /TAXON_ID=265584 /ORGANISM="Stauroneis constricta, Strain CCMP1120" /LENGTH=757 /DNA_ID=CAMNT_0007604199 /DNA_START=312 /DNA_END=2585 /DNA_ORIENTATION=+
MGNHASLDINLENERKCAASNRLEVDPSTAGEQLTGTVLLKVTHRKGIAPSNIIVSVHGKEHTILSTARNTFRDEHIFLRGISKLNSSHLIACDKRGRAVIPQGVHRIPFCFQLPESIPTTMRFPQRGGVNARIEYTVAATYGDDNATLMQNNKALYSSKLVPILALPIQKQIQNQTLQQNPFIVHPTLKELKSLGGMIHHANIMYAVNVLKPVVSVGETITVDLALWKSTSKLQIDRIEMKLNQYIKYKVTNDTTDANYASENGGAAKEHDRQKKVTLVHWKNILSHMSNEEIIVQDEMSMNKNSVTNTAEMQTKIKQQLVHDLATHKNRLPIRIEPSHPAVLDAYDGLLMNVSHCIKIKICTKNAMLSNPTCRIPIRIGRPLDAEDMERVMNDVAAVSPTSSHPVATALSPDEVPQASAPVEQAPRRIPSLLRRNNNNNQPSTTDAVPMASAVLIDANNELISPVSNEDENETVVLGADAVIVDDQANALGSMVDSDDDDDNDDNDDDDYANPFFVPAGYSRPTPPTYMRPGLNTTMEAPNSPSDSVSVMTHDIPETPLRRAMSWSSSSSSSSSSTLSSDFDLPPPPPQLDEPHSTTEHTGTSSTVASEEEEDDTAPTKTNGITLSTVLKEIDRHKGDTVDFLSNKHENDDEWSKFMSSLTIEEFTAILRQSKDQVDVAEYLARQFMLGKFTCAHCVAALDSLIQEYNRTDMVHSLLPFCSDVQENHDLIRRELNDWETIITNPMMEDMLLSHQQ